MVLDRCSLLLRYVSSWPSEATLAAPCQARPGGASAPIPARDMGRRPAASAAARVSWLALMQALIHLVDAAHPAIRALGHVGELALAGAGGEIQVVDGLLRRVPAEEAAAADDPRPVAGLSGLPV